MFYPSDQPPISQRMTMTHISNEELEAIKKRNADLQFCLDKEVARVMALTQQNAELLAALIWISVESESTAMVISRTRISMAAKEAIAKAGVK